MDTGKRKINAIARLRRATKSIQTIVTQATDSLAMLSSQFKAIWSSMPVRAFHVRCAGNGTGNPTVSDSYGVTSVTRTGVGTYRIKISQTSFLGKSVSGVLVPGVAINDASSGANAIYRARMLGFTSPDLVDIQIESVTVTDSPPATLTVAAVDLTSSDTFQLMGVLDVVGDQAIPN